MSEKKIQLPAVIEQFDKLRKKNPYVVYAGLGAIAAILAYLILAKGSTKGIPVQIDVAVGQSYIVENPNVGDTLLVAQPGVLSSADSQEDESKNICVVPKGSKATVTEISGAMGIPNLYVKLQITDGSCAGKTGWTTKANLKPLP